MGCEQTISHPNRSGVGVLRFGLAKLAKNAHRRSIARIGD
jgi:hypothetical protein